MLIKKVYKVSCVECATFSYFNSNPIKSAKKAGWIITKYNEHFDKQICYTKYKEKIFNTSKFVTYSNDKNVTIIWNYPNDCYARGTVEASRHSEEIWWIDRALVSLEKYRNMGIGSKMLKMLISAIQQTNSKKIFVTPGGYEGETKKQYNFYEKNGFIIPTSSEIKDYRKYTRVFYLS